MSFRIALVRLPRLLCDLVVAAFAGDDAQFDRLDDPAEVDLVGAPDQPRHDAVIAAVDDPWHSDVAVLKSMRPGLVVLGIRSDGRSAWVYEMAPLPRSLGALGPADLRETVLAAIGPAAT